MERKGPLNDNNLEACAFYEFPPRRKTRSMNEGEVKHQALNQRAAFLQRLRGRHTGTISMLTCLPVCTPVSDYCYTLVKETFYLSFALMIYEILSDVCT